MRFLIYIDSILFILFIVNVNANKDNTDYDQRAKHAVSTELPLNETKLLNAVVQLVQLEANTKETSFQKITSLHDSPAVSSNNQKEKITEKLKHDNKPIPQTPPKVDVTEKSNEKIDNQPTSVTFGKNTFDFPNANNSSDDEDDEASSYISSPLCGALHPGFEMVTRGIDISKLDLTEKYDDIGTVGKIFDLSCNMGEKSQMKVNDQNSPSASTPNPPPPPSQSDFSLPDHFTMLPMTAPYTQPLASIVHSINHLREDLSFNLDKINSEDIPRGAFLETEKYRQFSELLTNQSKYLTVYRVTYSTFSITTNAPKEILSRRFKSAYNRLPSHYQGDPMAVQNFVRSYGTHYLERVVYGGEIMFISKINVAIRELMPERKLLHLMTALYKKQLNDKTSPSTLNQYTTEEIDLIARNSETIAFFLGGNHSLVTKQIIFNEWRDSLTTKSHPIYITIKPITDLLPEGSKRDAVKEAIDIYLSKLYVQDLMRILNSEIYTLNTLSADTNYFIYLMQKELERPLLDYRAMNRLGDEVERWAFTPKWFFSNVQLVMKVISYGNDECGMPETIITVNKRSPLPDDERQCSTYMKGLSFRLRSTGYTEYGFNPAHIIIAPKINPYQIHFRLSPLAYKSTRVPGWIRLLRFCTYGDRLIRCIKLDETSYFARSYENFQVALKTIL